MQQLPIGGSASYDVANGVPQFPSGDRYNYGLFMHRERGVTNRITEVTMPEEDRKFFGGVVGSQTGALIVRNIFRNAGKFGLKLSIVRIAGAGSSAASVAASYTPTTTPAWLITTLAAHAAGVKAKKKYKPQNVQVGDTFNFGAYTHVAASTDPVGVVTALYNAIMADNAVDALRTEYDVTLVDAELVVEHKTANTAFDIPTIDATAAVYTPISIGTFTAAQNGIDDVGDWANGNVRVTLHPFGSVTPGKFSAEVFFKNIRKEIWEYASSTELVNKINEASGYVRWSSYTAGRWPTSVVSFVLAGGVLVAPVEADFYAGGTDEAPTGLNVIKGSSVRIFAVTEFSTTTLFTRCRDFAYANNKQHVYIIPHLASEATMQQFADAIQTNDVIGAASTGYPQWVKTDNEQGGTAWIPAYGWILGAGFTRVPQMYGDYVHIAPAGEDSKLLDAVDVWPSALNAGQIDRYVRRYSLNVHESKRGKGTYLLTSRTSSTNTLFVSTHIMRFVNELLFAIPDGMGYVLQKTSGPELRKQVVTDLTLLGKPYYASGALERSISEKEAWQVVADLSNNPLGGNRRELYADVLFIPSESVEAFRIRLGRNDGVLTASLVQ